MKSGWTEFESFCVYPPAAGGSYQVDATLVDIFTGDRSVLRAVPVRRTDDVGTFEIAGGPPWDDMPPHERKVFETRLATACKDAGIAPGHLDRPVQFLTLPRVRYIVPEVGSPGHDKEVPDAGPPFVPPFEPSWERLLDGDIVEPPDADNVFGGAALEIVQTVTNLGTGLKVLDVGCAAGLTGEAAKQVDPAIEWIGIDIVPAAVELAQRRLDAAHLVDIDRDPLPYPPGWFDVVVMSQLLEHLYNPWATVRKSLTYLKDGGCLLCGVPHAGHVAILGQLIEGRYPYSRSGPLDISHVRVFTAETLLQLVEHVGCQPTVLTKSLFRMTRRDETLMAGLLDAAQRAGIDPEPFATDGWMVGCTVLARKQHVTVARRSSLVRRAEKSSATGDYTETRRLLELETSLHPQNAFAFIRLAEVLKMQGAVEDAARVLDQCIELHHRYLPAHYELIRTLHQSGRTDRSLDALEHASTLNPKFFLPLQTLFS